MTLKMTEWPMRHGYDQGPYLTSALWQRQAGGAGMRPMPYAFRGGEGGGGGGGGQEGQEGEEGGGEEEKGEEKACFNGDVPRVAHAIQQGKDKPIAQSVRSSPDASYGLCWSRAGRGADAMEVPGPASSATSMIERQGRALWRALHLAAYMCPDPFQERAASLVQLVRLYPNVLACESCQNHFDGLLRRYPPEVAVQGGRASFAHYTVDLHNFVNKRLGKRIVSYQEADELYESGSMACPESPCMDQAAEASYAGTGAIDGLAFDGAPSAIDGLAFEPNNGGTALLHQTDAGVSDGSRRRSAIGQKRLLRPMPLVGCTVAILLVVVVGLVVVWWWCGSRADAPTRSVQSGKRASP